MVEIGSPAPSPQDDAVGLSGGDSEGIAAESVGSLPSWAQRMIGKLRSESAKHRQELQEARAELESARGVIADRRRGDALEAVREVMADPEDLGRFVELGELVGDDGAPDVDRYVEAARALVEERPHLGARPRVSRSSVEISGASYSSRRDPVEEGRERFVGLIHGE